MYISSIKSTMFKIKMSFPSQKRSSFLVAKFLIILDGGFEFELVN